MRRARDAAAGRVDATAATAPTTAAGCWGPCSALRRLQRVDRQPPGAGTSERRIDAQRGLVLCEGACPILGALRFLCRVQQSADALLPYLELGLLQALSIPVLVIAGDAFGPLGAEDLGRLSVSLTDAAARAADAGVRLALEFDARASFPNNLQSAVAVVEQVASPALGLCLDWFHYAVGPSKPLDLWLLSNENLAHVQLSDIADVPREMAADTDRILPGEGTSPPDDLVARLREIGYEGAVAVELHNPALWRVPPRQFGEIAMTCLRKVLGQAAM